jgi:hypothetical protein
MVCGASRGGGDMAVARAPASGVLHRCISRRPRFAQRAISAEETVRGALRRDNTGLQIGNSPHAGWQDPSHSCRVVLLHVTLSVVHGSFPATRNVTDRPTTDTQLCITAPCPHYRL